jgi:hypothetical protein
MTTHPKKSSARTVGLHSFVSSRSVYIYARSFLVKWFVYILNRRQICCLLISLAPDKKKLLMEASQMNHSSAAILLVVVLLPAVVMEARGMYSCSYAYVWTTNLINLLLKVVWCALDLNHMCVRPFSDGACKRVCLAESSDNIGGYCQGYKCLCLTGCALEAVAAASAPIRHWNDGTCLNKQNSMPSCIIVYNVPYAQWYLPDAFLYAVTHEIVVDFCNQ